MIKGAFRNKFFYLGFFALLSLCLALAFSGGGLVLAENHPLPFSPEQNIIDPGASSTPGGGCGPTDSNCYPTRISESGTNDANGTPRTITPPFPTRISESRTNDANGTP